MERFREEKQGCEGEMGGRYTEHSGEKKVKGRKERRERMVSIKKHNNVKKRKKKKEQSNVTESAGGMEQGHEDMCSFDDKEIRHKRMST